MKAQPQKIALVKKGDKLVVKAALQIEIHKGERDFVSGCPALDLYSQGGTVTEAEKNIAEAVELFLESCIERNMLGEVLTDCGFVLEKLRQFGGHLQIFRFAV